MTGYDNSGQKQMDNGMRQQRTEGVTFVTPPLSGSFRNRENIAVERSTDVVANVEAGEERDRHLESGQVFPSSYSWWNQRWIVSLAGPL